MERIRGILKKKPLMFLTITLVYLLATGFLRWGMRLPMEALWYLVGGIMGVYFLDIAEVVFEVFPSPFRGIVFAALFAVVSFFVVTSSTSLLGQGLVLSLYLTMIFWQIGEWQVAGNLNSWYRMVAGPVSVGAQRWILTAFITLFLIETYLFI